MTNAGVRFAGWVALAWQRFGWRHLALLLVAGAAHLALGPSGGAFLFAGRRVSTPFHDYFTGRYVVDFFFIFLGALAADAATDDGLRPLPAYALALVVGTTIGVALDGLLSPLMGWRSRSQSVVFGFNGFRFFAMLLQGGICLAVYAYHRTTQRSLARIREAEAGQLRDRQRLLSARLLALQARVEPEFLFDTLSRVGALHRHDPLAADALLSDLIALLRAMLPSGTAASSTVEREVALALAWVRVQQHLGRRLRLEVAVADEAARCEIAAMLVWPLLRGALAGAEERPQAWALVAARVEAPEARSRHRLRVELRAVAEPHGASAPDPSTLELAGVRDRLRELHGADARLIVAVEHAALVLTLDLPLSDEG